MKRLYCLITVYICFYNLVLSQPIDQNTAKIIGQSFLKGENVTGKLLSIELVYTSTSAIPGLSDDDKANSYFYVFNSGSEGFVIVSGNEKVAPILAYSTEGSFNAKNIPQSVAKWLENYKSEIRHLIESDIKASDEIKEQWKNLREGKANITTEQRTKTVNPLIQTKWDQSPHYNALCPLDATSNERTVTGCVATAMAQIMKYWNYPSNGTGFQSYNHDTYGTLSANFGGTTYQWDLMPNTVTSPNNAVATLMYHAGVSVKMDYDILANGGSGAQTLDVATALKTYFGYSTSVQGISRSNYTEAQWIGLLKTELDAGRPVQYAGTGSGGGHSFVCDGYDANGFFHFNWGWGGSSDGYFSLNALNPGSLGSGGGTGGYNSNQRAVISIQPPSNAQTFDLRLYNFVSPSSPNIPYGTAFTVSANLRNHGTTTFNGDYCAAIFDSNLKFVEYVEIKTGASLQSGFVYQNNLTFSTNGILAALPGKYYAAIYYRPTGGNWSQVSNSGSYTNFVAFNIVNQNTIELYAPMSVTQGTELTKGQPITVKLDVANYGATTFTGIFDVSLYKQDGSVAFTVQQLQNMTLTASSHYTNGLTFTNSNLNLEPGTYFLAIQHRPSGGNWELTGSTTHQNPIVVTVKLPPIVADQYESNNSVSQAFSLPLSFVNNTAVKTTTGSNCHVGSDYDYYNATLPPGFKYTITARLHDSNKSANGTAYTLDALFSYSKGTTWSDAYDDVMPSAISIDDGGTLYFFVSPYFTGATGTYLLDISIQRTPIVGIEEAQLTESISVYPNPASTVVNIDLERLRGKFQKIQITNDQGKEVYYKPLGKTEDHLSISTQDLSSGLYFVKLQTGTELLTKKILIKR